MNEVEELSKLDLNKLPKLKPFIFDHLHRNVLKNMHFELEAGPVLYLLSPSYTVINPTATEKIQDFITKKNGVLNYLKEYIVQNLSVFSVLLDINSYFIEQNNFLVLARLRERDSGGRLFEIKFYTHSPRELMMNYKDKIYIGRDFIDVFQFKRKYFGIRDFIASLKEQNEVLLEKAEQKLKKPVKYKSFFQEISEYVNELQSESLQILESLPPYIDPLKLGSQDLIDINAQYRTINHFLFELNDEVTEFENLLFNSESSYVRYVTKYKKDLENLISYFNIKIHGFLQERIYHFKNKA